MKVEQIDDSIVITLDSDEAVAIIDALYDAAASNDTASTLHAKINDCIDPELDEDESGVELEEDDELEDEPIDTSIEYDAERD